MLRTSRNTKESNSGPGTDVKNSTAAAATGPTDGPSTNKWQPLRSARKATAAVLRGQNQGKEQATGSTTTTAPTTKTTGSSVISSTSLGKGVQGKLDYSDSFSFAPMSLTVPADFVPVSSCDDIEPPTFEKSSNLKMSSNFSKLLSNAKKVDQVRHNAKMDTLRSVMDPDKSVDELQKEVESSYAQLQQKQSGASQPEQAVWAAGISELEKNKIETLSVEESQKRLIDQLKQGMNYIAKENKQLKSSKTELEQELRKEKDAYIEKLTKKHKEVEERNLKLAVLEAHFRQLNSDAMNGDEHAAANDGDEDAVTKIDGKSDEEINSAESMTGDENKDEKETEKKVPSPVKPTAVSSIIQIDKGYYNDLEDAVKRETAQRKQVEEFNRDMVAKYNQLVKESGNEAKELKEKISKQDSVIASLEQNVQQMRLSKFKPKKGKAKQSKGHRRHATVSAVPSDDQLLVSLDEQDDHSMSAASSALNEEASKADESSKKEEVVNIDEAIEAAVSKALEEKEMEHSSTMEVFSKQLELKDKIISRLESKMFGLVKNKNDSIPSPQRPNRAMSKDYMLRKITVTNELMDTSMRRLETMLTRLERMEDNDQSAPIRRMAMKVSSVHEEMKVAMKHIELRVENQVEKIREKVGESSVSESNKEKEDEQGGQTSGEGVESSTSQESIEDLIANVQAEATKALKESESSVKKEIDGLKDQLENIEFDMAEKADTIEALELACAEHEKKFSALQEEYERLQSASDN